MTRARTLIGFGARHMIERGLAHGGARPAADLDRMFDDFIAHYAEHVADRSRPFPGRRSGARHARRARLPASRSAPTSSNGCRCGCSRRSASPGGSRRSAGRTPSRVQKPNPEALLGTLRKAGGSRARAVMVGDSQTDIATARAARMPVVAVDFGYTEIPVTQLCPDKIISTYNALPGVIEILLQARAEP